MFHNTFEIFTDTTNVDFGFVRCVGVQKLQVLARTALEHFSHTSQGITNLYPPVVVICEHLTGDMKRFSGSSFWFSLHPNLCFVFDKLKRLILMYSYRQIVQMLYCLLSAAADTSSVVLFRWEAPDAEPRGDPRPRSVQPREGILVTHSLACSSHLCTLQLLYFTCSQLQQYCSICRKISTETVTLRGGGCWRAWNSQESDGFGNV